VNLIANPSGGDGLTGWWNWEAMRTDRVPSFGLPEGFSTCLSNNAYLGVCRLDSSPVELPADATLLPWSAWVACDSDGGSPSDWVIAPQYSGDPYSPDYGAATTAAYAPGEWQNLSGTWEVPPDSSSFWLEVRRSWDADPSPTEGFIYVCGVTVEYTASSGVTALCHTLQPARRISRGGEATWLTKVES
jgi:hypothetical protein